MGNIPYSVRQWGRIPAFVTLGIVTFLIFGQVLGFEVLFGWDDELYLLRRREVIDWFGASWSDRLLTPKTGYPVPVPTYLYHVAWQMPEGWLLPTAHAWNLLFHLLNILLVAMLGRWWTGDWRWATAVGLLWGAHPLLVESVAWITNLKGLTVSACILGSVILWEHYLDDRRWEWAAGVVVLGLVGLGCRPEAVMIGPILVACTLLEDWKLLREPKFWVPLGFLAAFGAAYLPVAMSGQQEVLSGANRPELLEHTWSEKVGRVLAAFGLQLEHIFWPVDLSPVYTRYYAGWRLDWWIGALGYLGAIGTTAYAHWRRHTNAVSAFVLFWCLWLPASGIVFLPRFTADTYMYLPLAGLLFGCAILIKEELPAASETKAWGGVALAVMLAAPLGVQSHRYTSQWEDTESLFKPLTYRKQNSGTVFAILTYDYIRRKKWERARDTIERGLKPLYDDTELSLEMVRAFTKTGDPARAADLLMKMFDPAYPRKMNDSLHAYFVWLLPEHDIPLPEQGRERDQFEESARKALSHFRSQNSVEALRKIEEYMRQSGMKGLADDYAAAARGM
mgnify:CR=1 FL=1